MTILYMRYTEYREGGDRDSDEPYTVAEPEYVDFHPVSLSLAKDNDYYVEHIKCDETVNLGDVVFLVVARYSDGDSFSTVHGKWYIAEVTKNANKAMQMKKFIEDNKDEYCEQGCYYPWYGYFSSLESVDIYPFLMQG